MNYDIEIQPAGVKYRANHEETVLNAALTNKLFLEHSCRKGACGLCSATLLSGSVKNEHGDLVAVKTIPRRKHHGKASRRRQEGSQEGAHEEGKGPQASLQENAREGVNGSQPLTENQWLRQECQVRINQVERRPKVVQALHPHPKAVPPIKAADSRAVRPINSNNYLLSGIRRVNRSPHRTHACHLVWKKSLKEFRKRRPHS